MPGDKLYKVDAKGELSTLLDPSNHTNGLMVNAAGNIVACEMDGRLIEVDRQDEGGEIAGRWL